MKLRSLIKSIWKRGSYAVGEFAWIRGDVPNLATGRYLTEEETLGVSTVYRCVNLLSSTVASLPAIFYEKVGESSKIRARNHPYYNLFNRKPNQFQSRFRFFERVMVHLTLRGNFYAQKLFKGNGQVAELYPLTPDRMEIKWEENSEVFYYEYTEPKGGKRKFQPYEILHIAAMALDGMKGLSPIDLAMQTVALAKAQEDYASTSFKNGVRPSGLLTYPGKLGVDAAKRLKEDFEKQYGGSEKAGTMIVLEAGMDYKQMGLTNEQAQFLQGRKFTVNDIARWFGLPPHMVGDLERATFSNIEHQALDFVIHSIRPWLERIEDEICTQVLTDKEAEKYDFEFLVDALLRGDTLSRYQSYQIGRNTGFLNIDEIRAMENRNPLPDGEGQEYLQPLNMVAVGEEPQKPVEDDAEDEEPAEDVENKSALFAPMLKEALLRCAGKEKKFLEKVTKRYQDKTLAKTEIEEFYRRHEATLVESTGLIMVAAAMIGEEKRSAYEARKLVQELCADYIAERKAQIEGEEEITADEYAQDIAVKRWLEKLAEPVQLVTKSTEAPVVHVHNQPAQVTVQLPAAAQTMREFEWCDGENGKRRLRQIQ